MDLNLIEGKLICIIIPAFCIISNKKCYVYLLSSYFTELAEELPDDTLILTLGCAKNRIIHSKKLLHKTLANGMPRVMDMGVSEIG